MKQRHRNDEAVSHSSDDQFGTLYEVDSCSLDARMVPDDIYRDKNVSLLTNEPVDAGIVARDIAPPLDVLGPLAGSGLVDIDAEVPVDEFKLATTTIKRAKVDLVVYHVMEEAVNADEECSPNSRAARRMTPYISWHVFEQHSRCPAAFVSVPYDCISAVDFRVIGLGDGESMASPYAQLTLEVLEPPRVEHVVPLQQCDCKQNACECGNRKESLAKTMADIAQEFILKPTLDSERVRKQMQFFVKRMKSAVNVVKSPEHIEGETLSTKDFRKAKRVSRACHKACKQCYVITTKMAIRNMSDLALIVHELCDLSFRNKQGHLIYRGIPSWANSFPRYTPRVRQVVNNLVVVWTILSLLWAIWQLYHYIDVFPTFMKWIVSQVTDLCDKFLFGYLMGFDAWLTTFTQSFFYQYRPLYVVAMPVYHSVAGPLLQTWYSMKSIFNTGIYDSLRRTQSSIMSLVNFGVEPTVGTIRSAFALLGSAFTPLVNLFKLIFKPLNTAASYSFVSETERMRKIQRVLTTQLRVVFEAIPNLLRRFVELLARKQVEEGGDLTNIDPLVKKIIAPLAPELPDDEQVTDSQSAVITDSLLAGQTSSRRRESLRLRTPASPHHAKIMSNIINQSNLRSACADQSSIRARIGSQTQIYADDENRPNNHDASATKPGPAQCIKVD